jgi:sugar lactone lactonase YvrE
VRTSAETRVILAKGGRLAADAAGSRAACTRRLTPAVLGVVALFFLAPRLRAQSNVIVTVAGRGAAGVTLSLPTGVAADAAGNFYVADTYNCVIQKISNGVSSVFAGIPGNCSPGSGTNPTQLSLQYPIDVVSCDGNVYFATHGFDPIITNSGSPPVGGSIYEINASGNLTMLPTPSVTTQSGPTFPVALACDTNGNVFVSSYFYLAEITFYGSVDEIPAGSQMTQNWVSLFNSAYPGIAVDGKGNVFVLQTSSVLQGWLGVPSFSQGGGIVQLFAPGGSTTGHTITTGGQLSNASRLAIDASGNFYVTQAAAGASPTVYVTTIPPGGGSQTTFAGNGAASYGGDGGSAAMAELNNANGLAFDSCGSLYIADAGNQIIRKVFNPSTGSAAPCTSGSSGGGSGGSVSAEVTLQPSTAQASTGQAINFNSNITIANCPSCTAPLQGEVFFCANSSAPANSTSSIPCEGGATLGTVAVNNPANATGGSVSLNYSFPIAGTYSVTAEYFSPPILPATSQPNTITVCGASCADPSVPFNIIPNSTFPIALTPGVLSTRYSTAGEVAFDSSGGVFQLNSTAGTITHYDAQGGKAQVSLLAAGGTLSCSANLCGMAMGSDGNLYIADTGNNRILKVVSPAGSSPTVSVITPAALTPALKSPMGIVQTSGLVYVTDAGGLGGTARAVGFLPDGSNPFTITSSTITGPSLGQLLGIAVNPSTLTVYIANAPLTGSTSSGNIIQVPSGGSASVLPMPGGVTLQSPFGLAMDPSHGLYISDTGTHQIYRMDVQGNVLVVAGNLTNVETGEGVSATATGLTTPTWLGIDNSNSIWMSDGSSVRRVDTTQALVDFTTAGQSQAIYITSDVSALQGSVAFEFASPLLAGGGSGDFSVASNSSCSLTSPVNLSPNSSCNLVVTLNSAGSGAVASVSVLGEIQIFLGPFNSSPSVALTQVVNLDGSASGGIVPLQIISLPSPVPQGTVGAAYAVTFLPTGGSGVITIKEAGIPPPGLIFNSAGTLSGTPAQAGSFPITVTAADSQAGTFNLPITIVINPARGVTSTQLTSSLNPSVVAELVTFTATVTTNGTQIAAGPVTFNEGGTTLASGTLNGAGVATFTTSTLVAGTHVISAAYGGDPNNLASVSGTVSQVVQAIASPVSLVIPETVGISDLPVSKGVSVPENVKISDAMYLTPLIGVIGVPAAAFSDSSLGFNNTAQSVQSLTVSNVGQAPLKFIGSYSISPGFTVGPILCSDGSTSLPSSLASGGQCNFTISYVGPSTSGSITFIDNAALSSPASTQSGPNYAQTIQLNGAATSSVVIGPPSATVNIPTIYEPIHVTDTFVPPVASVPYVLGFTQAAASTAFANAGLTTGPVTTAASATVAAGRVISQSPGAGSPASFETAVSIVISSGAPFVRISPSSSNPVRVAAGSSTYIVAVTLTNGGNVSIGTLTLVKATLGSLGALTFPSGTTVSNIAPGASATFTATFSSAAGAPGKSVPVSFTGTYTAGSLNGNWTASFRSSGPLP